MNAYAPLCRKQAEYIRRSLNSWLNVAEGGKRAGKNITNLISWAASLDIHPDKIHLAAGVSQSAAIMNIIDSDGYGLKHIFEGRCRMGQFNGRDALLIKTSTGEKAVVIAGGGDSRTAGLIKGMSLGTAYITEANECHQTFVQEVFDRTLASKKRQIFLDLNPKPPRHWFYTDLLDFQDELRRQGKNAGYNYEHFTIVDNRSIPPDRLRGELEKYDRSSIWYQRDILGKRTSASGRIYPGYTFKDVALPPDEIARMKFTELTVGIDVGGTDATAATLTGLTQGWKQAVHIDGLYHKQGMDNKMDEQLYAEMIAQWLSGWAKVYPQIGTVYVDSAAKLFTTAVRRALDRHGLQRFAVRGFDKSDGILERIQLTCMLLAQGRFKISSKMEKWHEAMQMAVWSDKEFERGEWVRVDDGSYPVDCLDSSEYSLYPLRRLLTD